MIIDFTIAQLATLDQAIQQLPYRVAAPLIAHINEQIEGQKKIMDTPVEDHRGNPKTHQQNGIEWVPRKAG